MPEKPPCEMCGLTLYRESPVRRCRPCGAEHDLCSVCVVNKNLVSFKEFIRGDGGRLLVCPDQVRVAWELMR